jgi:hypothetical protein
LKAGLKVGLGDQFGHDEVSRCLGVGFRLLLRNARVSQALGVTERVHSVDHQGAPLKAIIRGPLSISILEEQIENI